MQVEDLTRHQFSIGGQLFSDVLPKRRVLNFSIGLMTESSAFVNMMQDFQLRKGTHNGFIVVLQPDTTGMVQHQTLYCRNRTLAPIAESGGSFTNLRYRGGFSLEEML